MRRTHDFYTLVVELYQVIVNAGNSPKIKNMLLKAPNKQKKKTFGKTQQQHLFLEIMTWLLRKSTDFVVMQREEKICFFDGGR